LQIAIPIILLAVQFLNNSNFVPVVDNFWFRITGFIAMSYSVASLRKKIMDQVSWIMIDNNKILSRIDNKIPKPKTACLYLGLYINMIMTCVIMTNVYMLFCVSESLLDLILNMLALNFLMEIDNEAFGMMANYSRIEEVIKDEAKHQIDTMVERANFHNTRIASKFTVSIEYVIFYTIVIYSLVLPFIFIFYNIKNAEFDTPCLGAGNMSC
jgi:hypothetical protein